MSHNADAASPAAVQFSEVRAGVSRGRFVSSIAVDPTDARGPVKATVTSQPEARAPEQRGR